ncbi:hypothetical protein [Longispora albida]|uniref:dioxygenase family protein n=1 Tax=Longispora albida TaxID=203523 RepID=UPI000376F5B7|nr:hypothetical protein [Longispora albida]
MNSHENHDLGLAADLGTLITRRLALGVLGATTLAACGTTAQPSPSATPSAAASSSVPPGKIPEETAGPYPGDGSNGPNVLTQSGIVRSDIRNSFGTATGMAAGVPLTIALTIVDSSTGQPRSGAALYLWHCDINGDYSMYSQAIAKENYLRGVQVANAAGQVTFQSVFPGAYSGRWPHIHFEVYPSLAKATSSAAKIGTSQLALPSAACQEVYATSGYSGSAANLGRSSLGGDMVFRDGYDKQLATITGTPSTGLTVTLTFAI